MSQRASKRGRNSAAGAPRVQPSDEPPAGPPPDGWYELKYVKGCGPYLYFRYYDGPVRRSIYLGKASVGQLRWLSKKKHGLGSRHA